MHANTAKILSDMERMGLDVTDFRAKLEVNAQADNYLGAGVARLPEFTKIIQEKRDLEKQFNELATAKGQLNAGGISESQRTALLSKIAGIEEFLVGEGYSEDEVKNLFKDIKESPAPSQTIQATSQTPNQKVGEELPNEKIDVDDIIKRSSAYGAVTGFGLQLQLQKIIYDYAQAYGTSPTAEQLSEVEKQIATRTFQGGEAMEKVADEVLKISERKQQNATDAITREKQAEYERGRSEAFQEAGVLPTRKLNVEKSPLAKRFKGPEIRKAENSNGSPDENKDKKPFENRGTRESRLSHIAAVAASNPKIFEQDSYVSAYGSGAES